MSSDIYLYEAIFGELVIIASCIEEQATNNHVPKSIHIDHFKKDGVEFGVDNLDPKKVKRFTRSIRNKRVRLNYLGGYCSGGYWWGADNIRHSTDDE